jgi:hypothetical protein
VPFLTTARLLAFIGVLWLVPVGVADADRLIADDGASPPVRAYKDRLVWSSLEGYREPGVEGSRMRYALMTYGRNAVARLPLPVRALPFDVDVGPDETGATVAVYVRCAGDDTVSGPTLGPCALHEFDFATGQDSVAARAGGTALPSLASSYLEAHHSLRPTLQRKSRRHPRAR